MKRMHKLAEDYNNRYSKAVPCAIFQFVIECVCIVVRVFQKDTGHVLMIALPGSGCRTVLRLAALALNFKLIEVRTHVQKVISNKTIT